MSRPTVIQTATILTNEDALCSTIYVSVDDELVQNIEDLDSLLITISDGADTLVISRETAQALLTQLTHTLTSITDAEQAFLDDSLNINEETSEDGTSGVYVWGAQMEQGATYGEKFARIFSY